MSGLRFESLTPADVSSPHRGEAGVDAGAKRGAGLARPVSTLVVLAAALTLIGCSQRWMSASRSFARGGRPVVSLPDPTMTPIHSEFPENESAPTTSRRPHSTGDATVVATGPGETRMVPVEQTPASRATISTATSAADDESSLDLPSRTLPKDTTYSDEHSSVPNELASAGVREAPAPLPDADERVSSSSGSTGPFPRVDPEYMVRVGDELEVDYTETWKVGRDYLLLPGDEVRVELLNEGSRANRVASVDRAIRIQPDGKISLPYIGLVEAAGMNVGDLARDLTERYSTMYVDPEILVTLISTGEILRDLRESLRTSGGRTTLVVPDGTISLPQIGSVRAAGLRLGELQDEVNERYRRAMPGFSVTVRLAGKR